MKEQVIGLCVLKISCGFAKTNHGIESLTSDV